MRLRAPGSSELEQVVVRPVGRYLAALHCVRQEPDPLAVSPDVVVLFQVDQSVPEEPQAHAQVVVTHVEASERQSLSFGACAFRQEGFEPTPTDRKIGSFTQFIVRR